VFLGHVIWTVAEYALMPGVGVAIFPEQKSGIFDSRTFAVGPLNRDATVSRALDLVIVVVAIFLLLPVMAILAAAIWLQDRGSPVFVQQRIGRGGQPFACFKFRSMLVDSDRVLMEHLDSDPTALEEWIADRKLRNDPRVTALGRFLRKSSLDELPQLFNVLLGSMSLVGPRPIVAEEIHRYGRYFQHYCSMRPGITGLWQVSGRNDVSYRRRVVMDFVYSRSKSVSLDLIILTRTVQTVIQRRGCY
jgi:lipopolysaccharide/colanic/teichoic acid biosynthesis glycosyltransferase